ncbi:hypothetical protein [Ornithinimicrobium sp. W1665]|uniref:hypothetical protein n=1 Tax=Ornithinimicrobium sp. W1665 TaxID=3416666 RepID=UPI003CE8027E
MTQAPGREEAATQDDDGITVYLMDSQGEVSVRRSNEIPPDTDGLLEFVVFTAGMDGDLHQHWFVADGQDAPFDIKIGPGGDLAVGIEGKMLMMFAPGVWRQVRTAAAMP